MTTKLIETDVVIDYLRGDSDTTSQKINKFLDDGFDLSITQITSCELWYGIYRLNSKTKRIRETKILSNFLAGFAEIYTIDNNSSRLYGELCSELVRLGRKVPQFDLLNASIAIANQVLLVTRDKKHYPRINDISEFDFLELLD